MLNDIVKVEPRGGYRLWLQFQDGLEGEVDLGPRLTFQGVFASLRDPAYFARVRVNPELGTICWPNDADWGSAGALLPRDRAGNRDSPGGTGERQAVISGA